MGQNPATPVSEAALNSILVAENLNDDFRLCVKANLTLRCRVNKAQYASIKVCLKLLTLFPFSVSLISFLFLILSLWRHFRQLHLSATGYRDSSIDTNLRAIKLSSHGLLLFIAYYLPFFISTSSYFILETKLAVMIGDLVALIYPSSHSFILILGNNKLRQASRKVLCKVMHTIKIINFQ
ncbi:taste receptor type 2 member 7-like [Rhynchonycteris naso]